MTTALDLETHTRQLADISSTVVIETELLGYADNPWDHGLNETRVNLAIRNMETAIRNLKGLAKRQPRVLAAAE
jgi:hypothetical protein